MATREALHQATTKTVRRWVMTIGVTGIVATGAVFGAGLKEERDVAKERRRLQEAGPEAVIAHLESTRTELVRKKTAIEKQVSDFKERQKEQEKKSKSSEKKPNPQVSK